MRKLVITVAAAAALSGCTTTERDVAVGTGVGAIAGGIVDGGRGAVIGGLAGAAGGALVRTLRDGYCEYRDSRGRLYTARC